MPRQDVPYGGAICRLKERIAEIWDKLGEKLHSINGVEGDGAGNVEIVSGDAAITVSESPTGHFIEIGLDHGNLPSAAVSSVNGKTGAVRLDAADIPSEGNSNVQADIAANKAAINECFDGITSEQVARQNADAALQGNINAVQASIPGAAAAAVSNDPTVAQLAADVPGKLDKISSGSALKAYTHTGQSQGETAVVNGITANSIGLRDANGRMQAADPAAGATDKTLVTANWVSQTGDSAPNNLAHKNGNETLDGFKRISGNIGKMSIAYKTSTQTDTWFKMLEGQRSSFGKFAIVLIMDTNNNNAAIIKLGGFGSGASNYWCGPITNNSFPMANVRLTIDNKNNLALWVKPRLSNTPVSVIVLIEALSLTTGSFNSWLTAMEEPNPPKPEPVVGDTYIVVYTPSDVTS